MSHFFPFSPNISQKRKPIVTLSLTSNVKYIYIFFSGECELHVLPKKNGTVLDTW